MGPTEVDWIHANTDADLADLCERLSADCAAKKLVGLICIPIYKHGHRAKYTLSLAGTAAQNATYAAGAMATCSFIIREMALKDFGPPPSKNKSS